MLDDILKERRCFKLVCGAGNEDVKEVEKLVALYSLAGCNFFDLSAKPDIILAAKRGLEYSRITKDRYLCVSVGIKGDPHMNKAQILDNCAHCSMCEEICPERAIKYQKVKKIKCIGCARCKDICPKGAIKMVNQVPELKEILPPIINLGIDCIEFHAISDDKEDIYQKWEEINKLYTGFLSICVDRSNVGNKALIERIKNMLQLRKPYTTIIQADGAPMSGGKDDYKTTLQAVATAELVEKEGFSAYLLLSGGTNSKTPELAKMCDIGYNGIAIGSYARKIVKEYISRDDFLENKEIFNKALNIAKRLVEECI
ncbi:4Fe-4S binding protein [bacterium]|nr:4Fe-4S binding protein [bacterium]